MASSSRTFNNQPIASTSGQTFDNQPVTSSQASVNNNITDNDLHGVVRALTNAGFLPSNFNPFGSAPTNDNVAPETSSLSETNPSTTSPAPTATNTSSGPENSDASDSKGKKRSLPSDQAESDLPAKRNKTD
jgi:hypothetical protein